MYGFVPPLYCTSQVHNTRIDQSTLAFTVICIPHYNSWIINVCVCIIHVQLLVGILLCATNFSPSFLNREVMVVAIHNISGFVEVDKDGNWTCPSDKKNKHGVIPNPVCHLFPSLPHYDPLPLPLAVRHHVYCNSCFHSVLYSWVKKQKTKATYIIRLRLTFW
jgi:hypothetical protein